MLGIGGSEGRREGGGRHSAPSEESAAPAQVPHRVGVWGTVRARRSSLSSEGRDRAAGTPGGAVQCGQGRQGLLKAAEDAWAGAGAAAGGLSVEGRA